MGSLVPLYGVLGMQPEACMFDNESHRIGMIKKGTLKRATRTAVFDVEFTVTQRYCVNL